MAADRQAFASASTMHEEEYTRCPGCSTVFRVTAAQLALREGQVRCGQCKTVFDGNAQRVSLAPSQPTSPATTAASATTTTTAATATTTTAIATTATTAPTATSAATAAIAPIADGRPASVGPQDEAALGPPTVTLRDARGALELPPASVEGAGPGGAPREVPYEDRFSQPLRPRSRLRRTLAYAIAIGALFALILVQAGYHFRDAIAAHWPSTQPTLARVCGAIGCTIRPLRDAAMSHLSIDASDLQADPAHRGLLILTATVRNRAAWSLAYPYLELTLTDAQDQVVVRRVLSPSDYAGGTTDLQRGIPPNAEVPVKVFIDASATTQAGYRLYMFYP